VKFILLFLLTVSQSVYSHSLGPQWQDVKIMSTAPTAMFFVDAANVRLDVDSFTITVEDFDTGEPVAYSSLERTFSLKEGQAKRIRIFVKNEGRKRLKVCTWAKSTADFKGRQQTVMSAVCSGVRLQSF